MSGECQRCGAALPQPSDPDADHVACPYCQASNPLPAEWIRERERRRVERAREAQELARAGEARARARTVRTIVIASIVGVMVLAGGIAGTVIYLVSKAEPASAAALQADPAALARVTAALDALRQKGCSFVVTPPASAPAEYETTLEMKAGGNCVHVLASAASTSSARVRLTTPLGKHDERAAVPSGVIDLEHCPTETGTRKLDVSATPPEALALAIIDCAPVRERYRDDPAHNGLDRVAKRLESLRAGGCREVLFAPQTVLGEQSLTATLERGAGCAVVVAAGDVDNALSAELRTPLGRVAGKPAPAPAIELSYCAETSGPHPLTIRPAVDGYFTLAALGCAKVPKNAPSW